MIGTRWLSAMAFASPVDEPPPTQTTASMPAAVAASRARSANATGTCCATSCQRSAIVGPSWTAMVSAGGVADPSWTSITLDTPRPAHSAPT